jgi:hypothetical protein
LLRARRANTNGQSVIRLSRNRAAAGKLKHFGLRHNPEKKAGAAAITNLERLELRDTQQG